MLPPSLLASPPGGWHGLVHHCARRTTVIDLNSPSKLACFLSWNGTRVGPTAAVERAHSDRARSGSKGSARVPFQSFSSWGFREHRGPTRPPSPSLWNFSLPLWNFPPIPSPATNHHSHYIFHHNSLFLLTIQSFHSSSSSPAHSLLMYHYIW